MFSKKFLKRLNDISLQPGCYIYRDEKNKILYVGKARILRNRVSQYFQNCQRLDPKIQQMVAKIFAIETIEVDNELDALVLEANLIRKYKPKYNSRQKDDKRYIWVRIDNKEDFPRVRIVRDQIKRNAKYYGPYPSVRTIKNLAKRLRHIFPYRDCSRNIKISNGKILSTDSKPCLYYHIGLCDAPCAKKISKTEYMKNINKLKTILSGSSRQLRKNLQKEMLEKAENEQYEDAAIIRDKLTELEYVSHKSIIDYGMDELDLIKAKKNRITSAQKRLIEKLDIDELSFSLNFKIECYDISNIQGKSATGSMIVFIDGKPKKGLYRKFKIQTKETPDDFGMMREVLFRRLRRIKSDDKSFNKLPDLFIMDGGKGQLSSAFEILQKLGVNIPVIGLAKKEEEIFKILINENNKIVFKKITLRKGSPELFLIQRIRDEAHRFAIKYHRKLRSKVQIQSSLDSIPGIGNKTKIRLLKEFGSWNGIRKAPKKRLATIINNKTTMKEILRHL